MKILKNTILCSVCGDAIPAGRLQAIPNATTCVKHSTEAPRHREVDVVDGGDVGDLNRSMPVDMSSLGEYRS